MRGLILAPLITGTLRATPVGIAANNPGNISPRHLRYWRGAIGYDAWGKGYTASFEISFTLRKTSDGDCWQSDDFKVYGVPYIYGQIAQQANISYADVAQGWWMAISVTFMGLIE